MGTANSKQNTRTFVPKAGVKMKHKFKSGDYQGPDIHFISDSSPDPIECRHIYVTNECMVCCELCGLVRDDWIFEENKYFEYKPTRNHDTYKRLDYLMKKRERLSGFAQESWIPDGEREAMLRVIRSTTTWLGARRALCKIGIPKRINDVPSLLHSPVFIENWIIKEAIKVHDRGYIISFEFFSAKLLMITENPMWKWIPVFTSDQTLQRYEKLFAEVTKFPEFDKDYQTFNKPYVKPEMDFNKFIRYYE